MTQSMSVRPGSSRLRQVALMATVILLGAGAIAHAQIVKNNDDVEPWRTPSHDAPPPHATSSLDATKTTAATLTQQRETRTLATAVFATPAAAQRAADKAAAAYEPPIAPAAPKAEWLNEDSVHFGGRFLELTAPF